MQVSKQLNLLVRLVLLLWAYPTLTALSISGRSNTFANYCTLLSLYSVLMNKEERL